MKILLVDQDDQHLSFLARLLEKDGYEVLTASAGGMAVDVYARHTPDLVLLAVELGDFDGYHCARNLLSLAGERFISLILMGDAHDPRALESYFRSGAIDFLDYPVSPLALRAKLHGQRQMHELVRRNEQLRERSGYEVMLAKHMFDAVVSRSPQQIPSLQQWSVSAGHFSGDMLIHEAGPEGTLYVLLADMTGHGLTAAIGALPTADIFFAMARKGLSLGEMAAEINRKLHRILPVGHFCAATLLRLDPAAGRAEVWQGGQPPLWCWHERSREFRQLESQHLPLGVLGEHDFDPGIQPLPLSVGTHLLLFSDGLPEATNAAGTMFGLRGIAAALTETPLAGNLLEAIRCRLVSFLDGLDPHDDVSLLTLDVGALLTAQEAATWND